MHDNIKGTELPSAQALSYLGDAYHSLYVRNMLVEKGLCRAKELNAASLEYVTAPRQAKMYEIIKPHLLDDEEQCAKRAYNSTHLNPPKKAKIKDYRAATAFEAVIGMLYYIKDFDRLRELMTISHNTEDSKNDTEN